MNNVGTRSANMLTILIEIVIKRVRLDFTEIIVVISHNVSIHNNTGLSVKYLAKTH